MDGDVVNNGFRFFPLAIEGLCYHRLYDDISIVYRNLFLSCYLGEYFFFLRLDTSI